MPSPSTCRRAVHPPALAVIVWVGLWAGCEQAPAPPPPTSRPAPEAGVIAFVGAGRNDPLWPVLRTGAEQYASAGARMTIVTLCPDGDSARDQIALLAGLRDPDLRGLCIQPADVAAILPSLSRFFNQGICIVSMIQPVPERLRVAHVGFDEEAVGRELARLTVQVLPADATFMLLHAGLDDPVHGPRLIGFERQMQTSHGPDLLAEIDCRGDPREARAVIRDRAARYPRLTAWVALADWPLRGIPAAEEAMGPTAAFITFGGTPEHCALIRSGRSPAVLAANYRELGIKAAQFCEAAIRHPSDHKPVYHAPLRSVALSNLHEYERDWILWCTGAYPDESPVAPPP